MNRALVKALQDGLERDDKEAVHAALAKAGPNSPTSYPLNVLLGRAYACVGNAEHAEHYFTSATELKPDAMPAWAGLASLSSHISAGYLATIRERQLGIALGKGNTEKSAVFLQGLAEALEKAGDEVGALQRWRELAQMETVPPSVYCKVVLWSRVVQLGGAFEKAAFDSGDLRDAYAMLIEAWYQQTEGGSPPKFIGVDTALPIDISVQRYLDLLLHCDENIDNVYALCRKLQSSCNTAMALKCEGECRFAAAWVLVTSLLLLCHENHISALANVCSSVSDDEATFLAASLIRGSVAMGSKPSTSAAAAAAEMLANVESINPRTKVVHSYVWRGWAWLARHALRCGDVVKARILSDEAAAALGEHCEYENDAGFGELLASQDPGLWMMRGVLFLNHRPEHKKNITEETWVMAARTCALRGIRSVATLGRLIRPIFHKHLQDLQSVEVQTLLRSSHSKAVLDTVGAKLSTSADVGRSYPLTAALHSSFGDWHSSAARYDQAEASYRSALTLLPEITTDLTNCWQRRDALSGLGWAKFMGHEKPIVDSDKLLEIGQCYVSAAAIEEAIGTDASATLAYRQGRLAIARDDVGTSFNHMLRAAQLDPSMSLAFFYLGQHYRKMGDTNRAQRCFERAVDLNPLCIEFGSELVRLYHSQGQMILAVGLYNKIVQTAVRSRGNLAEDASPMLLWAHSGLALQQLASGNCKAAALNFQFALQILHSSDVRATTGVDASDEEAQCWLGLGEAYLRLAKHTSALKAFQRAAAFSCGPTAVLARMRAGEVSVILGDLSAAVDDLRCAAVLAGEDLNSFPFHLCYVEASSCLAGVKAHADARGADIVLLSRLVRTLITLARMKSWHGEQAAAAKLLADAACAARLSIKCAKNAFNVPHDNSKYCLAILLKNLGDTLTCAVCNIDELSIARAFLKRQSTPTEIPLVEIARKGKDAQHLLCREARSAYAHAVFANPVQSDAWYDLGLHFLQSPTLPTHAAQRCAEASVILSPLKARSWNLLGSCHTAGHGDTDKESSQHCFIRAIQLDSTCPHAWINLGRLYRRCGNMQLSREAFAEAQALDPEGAAAWVGLADAYAHPTDNEKTKVPSLQLITALRCAVQAGGGGLDGAGTYACLQLAQCRLREATGLPRGSRRDDALFEALRMALVAESRVPLCAAAKNLIGLIHEFLGRYDAAAAAYSCAIQLLLSGDEQVNKGCIERVRVAMARCCTLVDSEHRVFLPVSAPIPCPEELAPALWAGLSSLADEQCAHSLEKAHNCFTRGLVESMSESTSNNDVLCTLILTNLHRLGLVAAQTTNTEGILREVIGNTVAWITSSQSNLSQDAVFNLAHVDALREQLFLACNAALLQPEKVKRAILALVPRNLILEHPPTATVFARSNLFSWNSVVLLQRCVAQQPNDARAWLALGEHLATLCAGHCLLAPRAKLLRWSWRCSRTAIRLAPGNHGVRKGALRLRAYSLRHLGSTRLCHSDHANVLKNARENRCSDVDAASKLAFEWPDLQSSRRAIGHAAIAAFGRRSAHGHDDSLRKFYSIGLKFLRSVGDDEIASRIKRNMRLECGTVFSDLNEWLSEWRLYLDTVSDQEHSQLLLIIAHELEHRKLLRSAVAAFYAAFESAMDGGAKLESCLRLVLCLARNSADKRALEEAAAATKLAPLHGEAKFIRGWLQARAGQESKALKTIESAFIANPALKQLWETLGGVC